MKGCDHKFVDSRECLKCGVGIDELRRASAAELEALGGRPDPLDVRGPDGVSERWKRQFIPPEVRALADDVLANRGKIRPEARGLVDKAIARTLADEELASGYPQLDAAWRPVVRWASTAAELSGVTYGSNWLRLYYQLGAVSTSLMLVLEQVRDSVAPFWQDRIQHALLELRLGRQRHAIEPVSEQELAERARRRRDALLEGIDGENDE